MTNATEKKMTQREFFNEVSQLDTIPTHLVDFALERIEKLNEQNEKRKNAPKKESKVSEENAELMVKIKEFLATVDDSVVAKEIAQHLEESTQKASALLKKLVESGEVEKLEGSTKSKPYSYKLAE